MNIILHGYKIRIIEVYFINNDSGISKKGKFFEQLNWEVTNIGKSREIIIMGDLNSRTVHKYKSKVVGQHGEDDTNDNSNLLITMCKQTDLKILNGLFQLS